MNQPKKSRDPFADRAAEKQDEINEKISYQKKCDEWKRLKVGGDISVLAALGNCSTVIISKAVNKGEGSLRILRLVDQYFEKRKEVK